jgi:hypothetical protein
MVFTGGACPGPLGNGTPTVTLSVDKDTIAENGGVATVTATLDQESFSPVTVRLAYSGTAESGKDYTRSSMTITIPPFKTTGTVQLLGVTDRSYDGDRTVIVTIDSVTNGQAGNPDEVTVTVTDEPGTVIPTVTLSLPSTDGSQATEGGLSETGSSEILARLSNPSHDDVTVELAIAGTAVLDTNYTLSGTTITISAGETEGFVTATGKKVDGFNQGLTIVATIASIVGANESKPNDVAQQVTLYIQDTETAPDLTLAVNPTTPIAESGGTATITATLSKAILVPVEVPFEFAGTAVKDTNYTVNDTKITIKAGDTTGTLVITAIDDGLYKPDQTIEIQASAVENAKPVGTGKFTVTIHESLTPPSVTLTPSSFVLNENGGTIILTATLSFGITLDTSVSLGLSGTAVKDTDFSISAPSIPIAAGQTSGSVTLTGIDDLVYEGPKSLNVTVSGVTNGVTISGGSQQALGTINDSLTQPRVTLSLSSAVFAEAGGTTMVIATLSNLSSQDVTVNLACSGTAQQATEYLASGTAITIPHGSLTGAVTLTGAGNSTPIGTKTVIVDITTVTNGTESGTQQQTAQVTDELPMITLSSAGSPMAEAGGVATVTAELSKVSASDVTIPFTFSGTTVKDTNYTASAAQIVVQAGQMTGSLTLTGLEDNTYTGDRTIILSAGSVSNAAIQGPTQVTVNFSETFPSVVLDALGSPVAELGGTGTISATLSKASLTDVTVPFTFGGSAVKDVNYTLTSTQIVIPAGQLSGTITLTAQDDNTYTGTLDLLITVGAITNAGVPGLKQGLLNIADAQPAKNLAAGEAWLANNATQPGVVVLASGLQYKILTAGAGPKPGPTSLATVTYIGTLIDGTEFDSSATPVQFNVSQVIAGWTEALQLMPVGSRWMLYIPSNLAYGTQGSLPKIEPNCALIFDVTLISTP